MRFIKRTIMISFLLFTVWIAGGYIAALVLTMPNPTNISKEQTISGVRAENPLIATVDDNVVSAWLFTKSSRRAVILLTGIRGNRTANITRAELYL